MREIGYYFFVNILELRKKNHINLAYQNQEMKVNYLIDSKIKNKNFYYELVIISIFELIDQVQPPNEMKTPVKIIDDYMQFINDGFNNNLLEQTDFLVIGCLGLQGVGKSSLMSYIANKYIKLFVLEFQIYILVL